MARMMKRQRGAKTMKRARTTRAMRAMRAMTKRKKRAETKIWATRTLKTRYKGMKQKCLIRRRTRGSIYRRHNVH